MEGSILLFDPERPFFQHPTVHKVDNTYFNIDKFLPDVPDNKKLFTMRIGAGTDNLSYPDAAAQLIHVQAFSPAGIFQARWEMSELKKVRDILLVLVG